ncbi:phosphoribosyltransferase [Cryobacterium sp. PAMC25264]|uniref:phosphoribosyltransferase n=1 Tax=Cryobacterium sp. PAMC25264 TaxID=2861288 RepID=UPI001C635BF4|nr:phosphoribosyltransferase [Cryobacterium sp. PAMC25264]QYF74750.1 phosphoribosyltransferase [Cryobacterium sp. PAMC25264]
MTRIDDVDSRSLAPSSLSIPNFQPVMGAHVVVFEDSWVTGAAAQSVALALRNAGASRVSIVVIGRILNYDWWPTPALVDKFKDKTWNGTLCPVTGGACPVL